MLQRLRQKVTRTSTVLKSCLNIAEELETHCRKLDALNSIASSHEVLTAIKIYIAKLEHHRQSIDMIMQTLEGTAGVVSLCIDILAYNTPKGLANSSL